MATITTTTRVERWIGGCILLMLALGAALDALVSYELVELRHAVRNAPVPMQQVVHLHKGVTAITEDDDDSARKD